jgi:hypothetical protein
MHSNIILPLYADEMLALHFQLADKKLSYAHKISKEDNGGHRRSREIYKNKRVLKVVWTKPIVSFDFVSIISIKAYPINYIKLCQK